MKPSRNNDRLYASQARSRPASTSSLQSRARTNSSGSSVARRESSITTANRRRARHSVSPRRTFDGYDTIRLSPFRGRSSRHHVLPSRNMESHECPSMTRPARPRPARARTLSDHSPSLRSEERQSVRSHLLAPRRRERTNPCHSSTARERPHRIDRVFDSIHFLTVELDRRRAPPQQYRTSAHAVVLSHLSNRQRRPNGEVPLGSLIEGVRR